jgi:N-methylhydantoinase B
VLAKRFDPIELEILWQRLISMMDEVDSIIVKTTFSTILRESRDFACILTDKYGRSVNLNSARLIFLRFIRSPPRCC